MPIAMEMGVVSPADSPSQSDNSRPASLRILPLPPPPSSSLLTPCSPSFPSVITSSSQHPFIDWIFESTCLHLAIQANHSDNIKLMINSQLQALVWPLIRGFVASLQRLHPFIVNKSNCNSNQDATENYPNRFKSAGSYVINHYIDPTAFYLLV